MNVFAKPNLAVDQIPSSSASDAGKALVINESGVPAWAEVGGGGSSYQGFSPWPVDPSHCARVVVTSTSDTTCTCSVRRSITDTEDYSPLDDYAAKYEYGSELSPYMRFFDSEFCTFDVEIYTDEETGDPMMVVSELVFTISNPSDTLVALANAARGFFAAHSPGPDYEFHGFLTKILALSSPTTTSFLNPSPASFWVFA